MESDKEMMRVVRWWCVLVLVVGGLLLAACRKQAGGTVAPTPTATVTPERPAPAVVEMPLITPIRPFILQRSATSTAVANTVAPTSTPVTGDVFDLSRYRFQVAQAADDALFAGEYEAALALYRQVIEDEALLVWNPALLAMEPGVWQGNGRLPDLSDPNERERLTAYAYYRMMVVYAARADARRVLLTYEVLEGTFEPGSAGYPYAALGSEFWQRYQVHQDVAFSCSRARRYTDAHPGEILGPLGRDVYGRFGRDYGRDDICPFW
jgi:hypothetical protein